MLGWFHDLCSRLSSVISFAQVLAESRHTEQTAAVCCAGIISVYCLAKWALKVWMLGTYAETRDEYPEV